jgi:nitroreductase
MMFDKPATTQEPIHDIIARRWSGRAFDESKPVPPQAIISLCEAARWAPSSYGDEPWRYLVWDKLADPLAWQRAFSCLSETNQVWVKRAPLLMLSLASKNLRHDGSPNRFAQHDTGMASMALVLEAVARGLMAHQMGGFDATKIREEFDIPEHYICMAMIAIGYPASADILDGTLKDRELATRSRRPLGEQFFAGAWGKGLVK